MKAPDLEARMRRGDPSVWPRWDAQTIAAEDLDAAWEDVFAHRGQPGTPSTIRAYTHFAYCVSSCNFCMYWHEVPKRPDAYARHVDFLIRRIEWFKERFGRQAIASAYCGGGTPTAPPLEELTRYFEAFTDAFEVQGEFTVEGHPGITTPEKIHLLADHGVNRISMGIQTLDPEVLVRITRRNASPDSIRKLIETAHERGIIVNLDLILGLPEQTLETFRSDVERICELGPDIITLYLFNPVKRLNVIPGEEMSYEQALTPELRSRFDELGYEQADPLTPTTRSLRLALKDNPRVVPDGSDVYAQFDETPSHTIALGPGAYGHVFGHFWYRDVTAMKNLEADRPQYFGTPLDKLDESRSLILDSISSRRGLDLVELTAATGIEPRRDFPEAWALARAELGFDDDAKLVRLDHLVEQREAFIDQVAPELPATRDASDIDEDVVELALVATRRDETRLDRNRAALADFRESLKVPARGLQICRGVWVGPSDDVSISFFVGSRKADPLRVLVTPGGTREPGVFATTPRFSIAYGSRPSGPPNELERKFLVWLSKRMVAAAMRPPPQARTS